tara:strand:+ start:89 stop:538 length:450 start_codon:yes stop_codon:yes gene_type:complete
MSKKWASNKKDQLLVENFKKFMEEGDFSPIAEAEVKVADFIDRRYKHFSSVPAYVLTSVINKHRKQLEQMTKEEGIEKIAGLMNGFKEDAPLVKKLRGKPLENIMTVSLAGFVKWFLEKEEEKGNKLVNFTKPETGDEMSDEELYKDIF